ncbi:ribosome biogenesis GTPase YqeH [Paraliobacillus quinghaiensis]|uniref:Ribosome biogenesis GTPase YqeH n=1 Tax=Paraliobacillus quinghaiensis TaxID=470815 RepID=A0A917TNU8_9BACI|nr:ribosome biogenesis GTPase YqeH [Paraliobacillus quinghaiensis]GGM31016.1 ribosome biogenesis GTPase YqeH [Paraliobacillus quinghaiensis]
MAGIDDQLEKYCQGCGVSIQTADASQPGYVPESAIKNDTVVCRRCFRLKHYNEVQDVPYTDQDFVDMISQISRTNGLIVKLVDIFDFNGSFIKSLHRLTGNNPIILVGNKVDLLPKSTNRNKLKQWMKKSAADLGLVVQEVYLISATKGLGMEQVKEGMEKYRKNQDVYVVGSTNVGKSSFINRLIGESTGTKDAITTSYFPGTTLGFIEIPLNEHSVLYDTPGVINRGQIAHYMSEKDLKVITPTKEIKPRVYQLQEKQTLYIGGLARFDFIKGEKQSFVCYFANELAIHRTKLENADDLYAKHLGDMLAPPSKESVEGFPELKEQSFKIDGQKTDIVFPGLGWITVTGGAATVKAHCPATVSASWRDALI